MSNTDHVTVDWDDARATNRANWDDRVPIHEGAYDIAALDDPAHRSDVVRDDLPALTPWLPDGTLDGLDVCHLQCHIGTDTLSLARLGARMTGLDLSPASLEVARRLAVAHHVVMADQREARELVDHVLVVVGDSDLHVEKPVASRFGRH